MSSWVSPPSWAHSRRLRCGPDPRESVGWLMDGPGPDQPPMGPLVGNDIDKPSQRELEPRSVAPATCCTLLEMSKETTADGCDGQAAEWEDSEPTRVPLGCPDGFTPTRDHPHVRLVESSCESGTKGCRWAAARWSDGTVTRVPAECPDRRVVRRWSLGAAECYGPPPVLDPATAVAVVGRTTRNARPGSLFQRCRVVSYRGAQEPLQAARRGIGVSRRAYDRSSSATLRAGIRRLPGECRAGSKRRR